MEENQKDQPLRPRFTIKKSRIRDEKNEMPEQDFSPDKIIYIEIDDEITMVYDKIKKVRPSRIAIVIPKRAVVLQSVVNLKILKKKVTDIGKEILIITTDSAGQQFAEKAGILCVEKLFEKDERTENPVKNPPMTFSGDRPMRIPGKKFSISEVIHDEKPTLLGSLFNRIKERIKKKKKAASQTKLVFIAPNKQALFTLILVSVFLLLTIAYIALPGATIYITPRSTVLDPAFNVTFMDYDMNRGALENKDFTGLTLASFKIKPPAFTKKILHPATGKVFSGQNARGIITITNLGPTKWELAQRTRFQTEDGLVFRIADAVRVPAAVGTVPGTLDVPVLADEFDVNGQAIGARGNVAPTRFFLPGLKNDENRKKLYGENHAAMSGGVTSVITSVSADDIEAAQQAAKKQAQSDAIDDLKKYIEQQNLVNKTNLSLLADRNVLTISDPVVTVPSDLVGKTMDQFEVTVSYVASGIAFDKQELIDALKSRIVSRVDPDKKLIKVAQDDISYKFLDEDEAHGRFRLTATMRAIQMYELDPEKENGQRFIKKITDHITGARVQDAQEYLQQQTDEIAKVEIRTWPIWAPTIPNIADNIKFVIREDEGI